MIIVYLAGVVLGGISYLVTLVQLFVVPATQLPTALLLHIAAIAATGAFGGLLVLDLHRFTIQHDVRRRVQTARDAQASALSRERMLKFGGPRRSATR